MNNILILSLVVLLSSCRMWREPATVSNSTDTTISEHLYTATIPADSALLRALLSCDSAGNVILREYEEAKSRLAESSVSFAGNELSYKVTIKHDTVYVPYTTTVYRTRRDVYNPPVVIKQHETSLSKFLRTSGVILWYS